MGGEGSSVVNSSQMLVTQMKQVSLFFYRPFFFFWTCHLSRGILVPQPGTEPEPPALEARSLNPWTARDIPLL